MIDSKAIASPFKVSSVVSRAGTAAVTAWADNVTTTLQFGGGTANTATTVRAAAAGTVNVGENTVAQTTNLGSSNGASTTVVRAGNGSVHFAVNGTNKWSVNASNGDLLPTITNAVNVGEDSTPKRIGNVYAHNSLKVNDGVTSVVVSATAVTASAGLGFTAGGANPITFTTNGVSNWNISSAGHLLATDNMFDIGATGATRPRTVYARTSFVAQGATNSLSFSDGGITQSAGGLGITSTGASLNLSATGAFAVQIATNGSTRWLVDSAGHFQAGSDNAYDIGATGAGTRPRSIYVRTSFIAQGGANALTAADGSITQSAGGLTVTSTAAGLILAATGANTVAIQTNGSARLTLADTTATLADAVNLVVGTTTGTKIGTSTTQKLGFWNSAPVVQQASAALTNNVTVGGTTDQIDDFTDLVVYANDASTIRNDIYQIARKTKEISDALRLYGILG